MLVLDKSGSMLTTWDPTGSGAPPVTRWSSLHAVVTSVTTEFDARASFGAALFPNQFANNGAISTACDVNTISPEVAMGNNVIAGIPAAGDTSIRGGTPARKGIQLARKHLDELGGMFAGEPSAIILITDGAANCDPQFNFTQPSFLETYDAGLEAVVDETSNPAGAYGYPVYVVGIDIANANSGSATDGNPNNINPTVELNKIAVAGRRPAAGATQFYATTDQVELQNALNQVIADTLSCDVPLTPEPPFPNLVEVEIDGTPLMQVGDCATENGWQYTTPGVFDSITLCGTACDLFKSSLTIDANYFCEAG
jgi:hypothetical protein